MSDPDFTEPPKKPKRRNDEAKLQRECMKYLRKIGWIATRVNAGTFRVGDRRISGAETGTSDILACSRTGKFCAIEVKTPTGKVSEVQEHYMARVAECGGSVAVVRSMLDLEAFCEVVDGEKFLGKKLSEG